MLKKLRFLLVLPSIILFLSCGDDPTSTSDTVNKAPNASFTVTPESGDTSTTFQFDASGSGDNEDPTSDLQVRWDWESDSSWDTDYSTTKIASHKYVTEGTKTITLAVKDSGGLTGTTTRQISVTACITGSVTDIDGNVYLTVKIGDQWWMAENLRVTHYSNNDPIQYEPDNASWVSLDSGAYCKYDNADSNVAVFGLLYNWYAVDDSRNIAPSGWHVPTDNEWKELEMFLGMTQSEADEDYWRGTDEGGKLKDTGEYHAGTGLWRAPNIGATNVTCFTALPGGIRHETTGEYTAKYYSAFFLSSSEYSGTIAWIRKLNNNSAGIGRYYAYKVNGISIRCVKD